MTIRTRRTRTALAALATGAAFALAAASATAATAADDPDFLAPAELPLHPSSPWYAGPVTNGQPDPLPMCFGEALPSTGFYRAYWTDLDTNALQVTVIERDEQRAADFAALLRKDLGDCAAKVQDPDITAVGKDYGEVNVEDGAHVYGVHTTTSWGATDVSLFSVGRDGQIVTIVKWSQIGTFSDAPVKNFKTTTRTAVNKLS